MNTACVNKLSKHIPNSYIYYPFSQRINLIKQTIIIIICTATLANRFCFLNKKATRRSRR